VEVLAYDAFGRPLSVKDANGVITDKTYRPRGWLISTTVRGTPSAGDRITHFSYWPTGQIQQVTEADGGSVTYRYDSVQRLTDVADSAGNSIHYTLDNAGNRLKEDTLVHCTSMICFREERTRLRLTWWRRRMGIQMLISSLRKHGRRYVAV